MKTLDEYNKEKIEDIKEAKQKMHLSGVLCPKCKEAEMVFPNPNMLLMSNPPKKNIKCPKCDHRGYMIM